MRGFYVREACKDDGSDTRIPADEIGAALMQQHLHEAHGVALAAEFQSCAECGQPVLCRLGDEGPTRCTEHQ